MKLHVFCFDLPQSDACFIKAIPRSAKWRMSRPVKKSSDEATLRRISSAATSARRDVLRADIVLMRAARKKESEVARAQIFPPRIIKPDKRLSGATL